MAAVEVESNDSTDTRRLARRTFFILCAIAVTLVALGPALRLWAAHARRNDPAQSDVLPTLFDVNTEGNVPSWFAASLWLTAAILCLACGLLARRRRRQWVAMAVVCLLLSADEAASFHERLFGTLGVAVLGDDRTPILHFAWVAPGALFALMIVSACLRLVWSMPPPQRRAIVIAGLVFLSGALIMESVSGAVLSADGDRYWYVVATSLEEGLEKVAVITFVCALISLVRVDRTGHRTMVALRVDPAGSNTAAGRAVADSAAGPRKLDP